MRRVIVRRLVWCLVLMGQAAWGEEITVPSGQKITLLEVIANSPSENGIAIRYRFLAPAVAREGGTVDAETAGLDMDWLCQNYALPRLPVNGPMPAEIILSMSDRDLPFGQSDPEATQFFNAYTIETSIDGPNCLWEPF